MDGYRLTVFVHLLCGIVAIGLGLYWFIMLTSLRQKFDATESQRLLDVLNHDARWPHVGVPRKYRLRLAVIGWLIFAVLLASGLAALQVRGGLDNAWWWTKLGLLAALVVAQLLLMRKPSAAIIRGNLVLLLLIAVASAWMIR